MWERPAERHFSLGNIYLCCYSVKGSTVIRTYTMALAVNSFKLLLMSLLLWQRLIVTLDEFET